MRRRTKVRSDFVEALVKSKGVTEEVLGVGEDWRFDHPPKVVLLGWSMWRASGYKEFPLLEDVNRHNPKWIEDLVFTQDLYNWRNATSPIAKIAQETPPPDQDGIAIVIGR